MALLRRLLNLIIYSGREEACYPKSAAIILDTVRLMRLKAQKLINLRRYNIFFLSYLPDERMTNGVNVNKTCGIHVQVRLQEESKAGVCEPIGNLVETQVEKTCFCFRLCNGYLTEI